MMENSGEAGPTSETGSETPQQVEFRHVSKRFGGIQALNDINLSIQRGSIHGLVGENGAGKSTLGRILAGVYRPDSGEIWVAGRRVDYAAPREALADGVTIIAQEPTLVPRRTALENVFLGIEDTRLGLTDSRTLRRRFKELVENVGFDLSADQLVGSLSVADQQKVEIVRAVARQAATIVMDEPTAALTFEEAERLFETVRRLRRSGTTIVYVSHFLNEVIALVDTVTVMRDGRLVRTSPVSQETPASLVSSMLGRSMDLTFPHKQPPAADARAVLAVRHLSALSGIRDVSFEIREGEILGLAGLIGSGRSEVARALFGADRREFGDIVLNGTPITIRSPRDAIRAGIVMLPENRKDHGLLMRRSVTDNTILPHLSSLTRFGLIAGRSARQATQELMSQLDVRARGPGVAVGTLSGGNQQKVLFGKWLMRRPLVLLADEPTRGIDVGAKRAIYELINSLAAEGMAVLLISSEHEEVIGLAHRVLVMRKGAVVAELRGDEINEQRIMHTAFAAAMPEAAGAEI